MIDASSPSHAPPAADGAGLIACLRTMARYNAWMNERLYEAAATLSDEERKRDIGAFFGSLHGTLNHLLLADRIWLGRVTGDPAVATSLDEAGHPIEVRSLDQVLYADFGRLRSERVETDREIVAWGARLDERSLAAPLAYSNSSGKRFEHPLWWAAVHLFNHQTHHRGQATTLLSQLGRDPGVTDLIALLRVEGPR